jgi:HlyD family secretion protein
MNFPARIGRAEQPASVGRDDRTPNVVSSSKLRRSLLNITGVFLVLLLLAAFVPIGGAVLGTGQVGVESRVKRVAHPTGGVIAQILVVNGQHVEAGQLLMRLDDRVTGADALYSNLTVEQLLAQRSRLEAERLGSGSIVFPAQLTQATTASARRAISEERRLFAIRQSEQAQLRAQLVSRSEQLKDEISGYQGQIQALEKQRSLIEPERRSVQALWDKQLVTINRVNQLERTAADLEGSIAALRAQIASARGRITETQEQVIQLRESRRAEAGQELSQVNTALNQQQLRSITAGDQQDRSKILAPYSGTVEKIMFAAIGDVVRPAEPIMEIVPDADRLVVEALIAPEDIDQVRQGQKAAVRFTSFNRSATPEIDGQVTYVAADRSENATAQLSFFMVRIEVDQQELAREGLQLRSGMPVEVHIQTGDRSLLSYIFKPLRDQLARAFRYD